jgi:hypothetical protein
MAGAEGWGAGVAGPPSGGGRRSWMQRRDGGRRWARRDGAMGGGRRRLGVKTEGKNDRPRGQNCREEQTRVRGQNQSGGTFTYQVFFSTSFFLGVEISTQVGPL